MTEAKSETGRLPPINAKDFLLILGLGVLGTIAWLVPQKYWWRVCTALAPAARRFATETAAETMAYVRRCMGPRLGDRASAAIVDELAAHAILRTIQILRMNRPGRPWAMDVELSGAESVTEALEAGRGAVIWIGYFGASNLPPQIALSGAGVRFSHLSELTHGFSSTRFGLKWLNPLRTNAELRFLEDRIVMGLGSPAAALREARRRLAANGVVSVNAREKSSRPVRAPFLSGHIELATGALDLAYAAGAAVLPIFAIREDSGRYRVTVEGPLPIDHDKPRRAAAEQAAAAYASRLEPYVVAHPGQWAGWDHPVE